MLQLEVGLMLALKDKDSRVLQAEKICGRQKRSWPRSKGWVMMTGG